MGEPVARSQRQVFVADHLWDSFGLMSQDMGVERDALISQALFAFARQHGYLSTTAVANRMVTVDQSGSNATPEGASAPAARPAEELTPPPLAPPLPAPSAAPAGRFTGTAAPVALTSAPPIAPPSTGFTGANLPVLELPVPEPSPAFAPSEGDLGLQMAASEPPAAAPAPTAAAEGVLVLYAEGREVDRVVNPRFLIGRGKHCDLIINSGKVSREHAAIIREGEQYFIEDLGSSNGTWFDKKRITRRKIDEGDEYFVCSEKITCRFM